MHATTFESYFHNLLAARASNDEIAAPATIESLAQTLSQYLPEVGVDIVVRAHGFAQAAHAGQTRLTGHSYITHPLAVANILSEMHMDEQSIAAAVLHDVLEDTGTTKSDLVSEFGGEVAHIVDGVSKLGKMFRTHEQAQAENFQKMAIAMANDLRVILVKLADRLHNMRTIGVMPLDKRRRISRETLDFYAPIANRLGMHNLCTELEELGFEALYPLRADRLRRSVDTARRTRHKALMDEITTSFEAALLRDGIDTQVHGREKTLYSIYKKMKTQRKPFADIVDVFGFRIIVSQVEDCYRTLGVAHNLYKPVAGRFKDYVAIPKANGYQSLHTTLIGMRGVTMEVQIRTREMDAVADHGIAGHWLYKSGDASLKHQARASQWVNGVLDLQRRAGDPQEFIESLKTDLFPDEVYVFTPKGDIFELPKGACPVDFAYAVHTDIGNHCVACRVDRTLAPLSQQLESGQTVNIVTSPDARPSPSWLTFAVSGRARSAIRQALKVQHRSESIALGRRLLNRSLENADASIKDFDFRRLRKVFREFGVRKLDEVLAGIGTGNLMAYAVAQRLLSADNPDYEAVDIDKGGPVAIRGGEGLVISCGRCCGPVPGDAVIGHVTPERGLVVHVDTCPNMESVRRRTPNQIIPVRWTDSITGEFETMLMLTVNRRKGVLAEIAASVNQTNAGISNIRVDERNAELSSVTVDLSVSNRDHLNRVRQRLLAIPAVQSLRRIVG